MLRRAQMSALGFCAATSGRVTKVGNGPFADQVTKGGVQSFTAVAKTRTDFPKAGFQFKSEIINQLIEGARIFD